MGWIARDADGAALLRDRRLRPHPRAGAVLVDLDLDPTARQRRRRQQPRSGETVPDRFPVTGSATTEIDQRVRPKGDPRGADLREALLAVEIDLTDIAVPLA